MPSTTANKRHPLSVFSAWLRRLGSWKKVGRHGGRGGPGDQPVATGGDGNQTEPPVARE
jgi:hypothetical protein